MGHSAVEDLHPAIEACQRARRLADMAELAHATLLSEAAAAAVRASLSVRQFANAAGISKSHAARAMRIEREGYAIHPDDRAAFEAALQRARRSTGWLPPSTNDS